jgi:hypothetical protein
MYVEGTWFTVETDGVLNVEKVSCCCTFLFIRRVSLYVACLDNAYFVHTF